ncbi:MAG: undecaprenyl/decaprenyl-phosphate alpha-N-acetylglucosaminyl 1-phosphate transferase, partial [Deltaproteobacteria bacterium]
MDFLFVFAASAVTLLLVGPAKAIAHKLRLLDYPSERKIHASPIPRAGGLVVIPVVITVCLLRQAVTGKPCLSSLNFPLVGGSVLLIYAAGLADDRWGLRARHKFLVQFVSSLAAVLGGAGFSGVAIPYDGALSLPPFLASILTVFWLSGLTNAYNLLDGMDGLFSTVSGSAALFISFAGFLLGNTEAAAVAAILGASLFSLIPENSPPARIFPGDSASMTTGFLLGLLTLLCLRKPSGEVE